MSDDIRPYLEKISEIKDKFISTNDAEKKDRLLKEMRIIHGKQIVNFYNKLSNIKTVGNNDDDYMLSSVRFSCIILINDYIKECEMKTSKGAYKEGSKEGYGEGSKEGYREGSIQGSMQGTTQGSTQGSTQGFKGTSSGLNEDEAIKKLLESPEMKGSGRMFAVVRKNPSGSEELSLRNIETETELNQNVGEKLRGDRSRRNDQTRGNQERENDDNWKRSRSLGLDNAIGGNTIESAEESTTEFLNRLGTEDADELVRNYEKGKMAARGGHGSAIKYDTAKPVIINMCGLEWCPPSQRFKAVWTDFESKSKTEFPWLQTILYDVKNNDPVARKHAQEYKVKSFPSLVLVYIKKGGNGSNDQYQSVVKPSGGMNVEDIRQLVKQHQPNMKNI